MCAWDSSPASTPCWRQPARPSVWRGCGRPRRRRLWRRRSRTLPPTSCPTGPTVARCCASRGSARRSSMAAHDGSGAAGTRRERQRDGSALLVDVDAAARSEARVHAGGRDTLRRLDDQTRVTLPDTRDEWIAAHPFAWAVYNVIHPHDVRRGRRGARGAPRRAARGADTGRILKPKQLAEARDPARGGDAAARSTRGGKRYARGQDARTDVPISARDVDDQSSRIGVHRTLGGWTGRRRRTEASFRVAAVDDSERHARHDHPRASAHPTSVDGTTLERRLRRRGPRAPREARRCVASPATRRRRSTRRRALRHPRHSANRAPRPRGRPPLRRSTRRRATKGAASRRRASRLDHGARAAREGTADGEAVRSVLARAARPIHRFDDNTDAHVGCRSFAGSPHRRRHRRHPLAARSTAAGAARAVERTSSYRPSPRANHRDARDARVRAPADPSDRAHAFLRGVGSRPARRGEGGAPRRSCICPARAGATTPARSTHRRAAPRRRRQGGAAFVAIYVVRHTMMPVKTAPQRARTWSTPIPASCALFACAERRRVVYSSTRPPRRRNGAPNAAPIPRHRTTGAAQRCRNGCRRRRRERCESRHPPFVPIVADHGRVAHAITGARAARRHRPIGRNRFPRRRRADRRVDGSSRDARPPRGATAGLRARLRRARSQSAADARLCAAARAGVLAPNSAFADRASRGTLAARPFAAPRTEASRAPISAPVPR